MKKILILMFILTLAFSYSLNIFDDDFDQSGTNLPGWKRSSTSNVLRYTGKYKKGLAALQLKGSSNALTYINVSVFKDMVLKFNMAKYSLESGEYIICEYNINGSWVTAGKVDSTKTNGTLYSFSVNIPTGNVLQIRFRLVANSTSYDFAYIDNIVLTGNRK